MSVLLTLGKTQMVGLTQPVRWPDLGLGPDPILGTLSDDAAGFLRGCGYLALLEAAGQQLARHPLSSESPLGPPVPLAGDGLALVNMLIALKHVPTWKRWIQMMRRKPELPAVLWPTLLELGTANPELQLDLQTLADNRGRWLAGLHPGWAWLNQTDEELLAGWEKTSGNRMGLLKHLLERNRTPTLALIMDVFPREASSDREKLLDLLAQYPGPDVLPLLERCQKDRARGVRYKAALLLSRLSPEMAEELTTLMGQLFTRSRWLNKIEFVPPSSFEPRWKGWGIDDDAFLADNPQGLWLRELIGLTPLSWWSSTGDTPEKLLDRASATPFFHALQFGWYEATLSQGDAEWAEALVAHAQVPEFQAAALVTLIAPERRLRHVLTLLGKEKTRSSGFNLIRQLAFAYTESESLALLKAFEGIEATVSPYDWDLLSGVALWLHPNALERLERLTERVKAYGQERILTICRTRLHLYKEEQRG